MATKTTAATTTGSATSSAATPQRKNAKGESRRRSLGGLAPATSDKGGGAEEDAEKASEPQQLSLQDVAVLVRLCRQEGVSSLRFRGLSLKLEKALDDNLTTDPKPDLNPNTRRAVAKAAAASEAGRVLEAEHAHRSAEDTLAELAVTDPDAYEDLATAGDGQDADN